MRAERGDTGTASVEVTGNTNGEGAWTWEEEGAVISTGGRFNYLSALLREIWPGRSKR